MGQEGTVLAGGEASEDEDKDEEQALVAEDPKQAEGVDPENAEPDVGATEVAPESGEVAASAEDITGE